MDLNKNIVEFGLTIWQDADIEILKGFFEKSDDKFSYENHILYFLQIGRESPYKYFDGENFFIFCRARELNFEWMIIFPFGKNIHQIINQFCTSFFTITNQKILLKKINSNLTSSLLFINSKFEKINLKSYINAPINILPDDIYPQTIFDYHKIFDISNLKRFILDDVYIPQIKSKYRS